VALWPVTSLATVIQGSKKRVLIGAPIKQKPAILREFLLSLEELNQESYFPDYMFIDDNDNAESAFMLMEFAEKHSSNCLIIQNVSERNEHYECNEITHYWNERIIWKVAAFKDHLIEHALEYNYDYLFLVDSDIVLHPKTLDQLIFDNKDIISEIFWTSWSPESHKQPQVWISDVYTQYEVKNNEHLTEEEKNKRYSNFLQTMATPGLYEVGGLGACTLISKSALKKGVNFKKIKNLTFWGEDRHFCIRSGALGIPMFVDTYYPAYHIYRETYLEGVATFKENCRNGIYQI
jgi:GT2 family glycosyltransferase